MSEHEWNDAIVNETAIRIRNYAMKLVHNLQAMMSKNKPQLDDLVIIVGVGMHNSGSIEVAMKEKGNKIDLEALDILQGGFTASVNHISSEIQKRINAVNN